jgi:hypothetical protein
MDICGVRSRNRRLGYVGREKVHRGRVFSLHLNQNGCEPECAEESEKDDIAYTVAISY